MIAQLNVLAVVVNSDGLQFVAIASELEAQEPADHELSLGQCQDCGEDDWSLQVAGDGYVVVCAECNARYAVRMARAANVAGVPW